MISERVESRGRSLLQCEVCGQIASRWDLSEGAPAKYATNGRCPTHSSRNPCAIEGCRRSTAAPPGTKGIFYGNDQWLCGDHWKRYVPPRSNVRKAYHWYFRQAKRQGDWSPELRTRFWTFWDGIIRMARRRATAGHIDQAEIEKLFGWNEGVESDAD